MATTVCIYFRFRQVLFRYVRVIEHVFCYAGVLVCLFVVTVADFWYDVMENRLSNSKLHYEFIVPHFWLLSFAGDPSISFQSHFVAVILSTHSYLVFVCVGCYCDRFLFVGMVQKTLRKLGRCQMTQLI